MNDYTSTEGRSNKTTIANQMAQRLVGMPERAQGQGHLFSSLGKQGVVAKGQALRQQQQANRILGRTDLSRCGKRSLNVSQEYVRFGTERDRGAP